MVQSSLQDAGKQTLQWPTEVSDWAGGRKCQCYFLSGASVSPIGTRKPQCVVQLCAWRDNNHSPTKETDKLKRANPSKVHNNC